MGKEMIVNSLEEMCDLMCPISPELEAIYVLEQEKEKLINSNGREDLIRAYEIAIKALKEIL